MLLGGGVDHALGVSDDRYQVQVASVLSELAHELREVSARLGEPSHPAEAPGDVAARHERSDLGELGHVDLA